MPIALFTLTLGGLAVAACYHVYCLFFGARLVARCRVPGDAAFELQPGEGPVRISVHMPAGPDRRLPRLQIELEREGSWQWTRVVDLGRVQDRLAVERLDADRPGRYRIKVRFPEGQASGLHGVAAVVDVYRQLHEPRRSVYVVAGSMLAGGFVGLMFVLA
jgi:hypothetical protein